MATPAVKADGCVVGASLKRKAGNRAWVAHVYRRDDGVKTLEWRCPHRHINRDAAVVCASQFHHALHA